MSSCRAIVLLLLLLAGAGPDSSPLCAATPTEPPSVSAKQAPTNPFPKTTEPSEGAYWLEDNTAAAHDQSNFMQEVTHLLLSLGIILLLILGAAWLLKRLLRQRMEQINSTSRIKIIERRALSPKSTLYLLQCQEGPPFLIAEGANGVFPLGLSPEKGRQPVGSAFEVVSSGRLEETKDEEA